MSPEPPLDATGIARRHFSAARKGYDPAEVRGFLHEVSDLVGRLQRGEAHQLERAERAEARAELAEQLDQHRLVELLGEETARVLDAARDAAGHIRAKAEESVARMIRDAQDEAHKVMERAELDAAARKIEVLADADGVLREAEATLGRRRVEGQELVDDMRRKAEAERDRMVAQGEAARAEAEADAERMLDAARDQARQLVGEAEAVRERMLGDLARRRRSAREQLERLNAARERLLAAYEVVRRTVDEATTELTVALPQAKAASEMALRRVSDEPEPTVEELEAELAVARMAGLVEELGSEPDAEHLDALIDGGLDPDDLHLVGLQAGHGGESSAAAPPAAEPGETLARAAAGALAPVHAVSGPARTTAPPAGAQSGQARHQGRNERWGVWPFRRRAADAGGAADPSSDQAEMTPSAAAPAADVLGLDVGETLPPLTRGGDESAADARRDQEGGDGGPTSGDVPDPDEADVDRLFARLKAGQGDSTSPISQEPVESSQVAEATDGEPPAAGAGAEADAAASDDTLGTADAAAASASGPGHRLAADDGADSDAVATELGDAASEAAEGGPASDDDAVDAEPARDDDADDDPDTLVLRARDTALEPVERALGRRLKRVLADEQNVVFELLRRDTPQGVDDVVPHAAEHADHYARAALRDLDAAAGGGAASVDGEVAPSCDELAGELGRSLVEPLRERIARSFDDCEGDLEEVTERLRSLYREWKGQRIGPAVRHYCAAAYSWGAYQAAPAGAELRWIVDRNAEACPDADDNALAGHVSKGKPFPTGDRCSPAHPGCRCLVVPVSRSASRAPAP